MLNTLKFVRGAVATKDLIPVLTHFHIKEGRIQGGNSRIHISAPIALDMDLTVPAERFIKAIDSCSEEPTLKRTPAGKLSIHSGAFKALLPLSTDEFPLVEPEGKNYPMGDGFIRALNNIRPFITDDATRPWACGALIKEGKIYATNNVILCQMDFPVDFPDEIVIPIYTIDELIRIGEQPQSIQITENQATFHYSGDRWVQSNLFSTKWPDLDKFFADMDYANLPEAPKGLHTAVSKVLPFMPNPKVPTVYLKEDRVSTGEGDVGADIEGFVFEKETAFHAGMLLKVLDLATHIDFSNFPKPCPFKADGIHGVVVGVRVG